CTKAQSPPRQWRPRRALCRPDLPEQDLERGQGRPSSGSRARHRGPRIPFVSGVDPAPYLPSFAFCDANPARKGRYAALRMAADGEPVRAPAAPMPACVSAVTRITKTIAGRRIVKKSLDGCALLAKGKERA